MTPTAANPAPERRGSPSKLATPLLLIATLLAWLPPATASAQGSVPVKVGGDPESDACGGLGRIVGLDPGGDNFLAVREGPASTWAERDRLGPDTFVAICDERGAWLGIVYPAPGTDADCGVSSPQETHAPYRGPCRWGWVHRRFVALVAG